jgi:hypothetical protein
MHNHTCTRAAGVSRPWVFHASERYPYLNGNGVADTVRLPRLAYASRSCSRERVLLLMCVFDRLVRYVCHKR